ncbi:MAG: glucosyl transferase, partial [Ignavibacteriaceae bacterium]
MKYLYVVILIVVTISLYNSCNTTEPPNNQTLKLELEDVSCTEVWLQLTTSNIQLPATINLLKNNVLSKIYVLNTQDSLLYIDSLLPNQNYFFQVSSIPHSGGQHQVSSIRQQVTTMDTTSHNFTWQTFTWGNSGSSLLKDVAIINE